MQEIAIRSGSPASGNKPKNHMHGKDTRRTTTVAQSVNQVAIHERPKGMDRGKKDG